MKISATQYASALYETTFGKSEREVDDLVVNLVKILGKNRQIKLTLKIIEKFSEIYNQKNAIIEAKIISYEKLDSNLMDKLNSFIIDKYQAKRVVLNNVVDKKIGGGIMIKIGDSIMDGSIRKKLINLKNTLTN